MVFSLPEYTERIKRELRYERVHCQTLIRSCDGHKKKIEELTKKNKQLEKELEKVKKENGKLKEEIEKVTKTQNRYRVALFDHGNFKTSSNQNDKKPKGGQIGHPDTNQDTKRSYASFKRQRVFAKQCGTCGHVLSSVTSTKQKTLIDIKLNTDLIEMIVFSERQWCSTCKKEVRAMHPQSLPFTEYGINTFMAVMYLRFKGKQSFLTIAQALHGLFGLSISKAGIGAFLAQAKEYLREKYEDLKEAIRNGEIMYNDETGWSVRGKSAWMWIMANEKETVYVAAESRGKGIMEDMYGDSLSYSMHDGYAGYTNTIPVNKQLYCWAHFLRFIHEETILSTNDSIDWHIKEKLVLLYQTIRFHPEYSSAQKEKILIQGIDEILVIKPENQTIRNIQHRLKVQRNGLTRSLLVTTDGTNNLAERELRPLTISRNISYGSDTYQGMETTAILASVVQTISRDKTNQFLPTLKIYLKQGIQERYPQYKHDPSFAP